MSVVSSYNPTYGIMCVSKVNFNQTKNKDECLEIIESLDFGTINSITYLPDRNSKNYNMYSIYVKYSSLNEDNEVLISYFDKLNESKEEKIKNKFKISINHDFKFNVEEPKKYWIAKFKNRETFNVGSKIWDSLIGY